jgi:hypothetical protein
MRWQLVARQMFTRWLVMRPVKTAHAGQFDEFIVSAA